MCVFLISPVPIAEPLTSELIDTPVFHYLAPRPIKYRVSVPIPTPRAPEWLQAGVLDSRNKTIKFLNTDVTSPVFIETAGFQFCDLRHLKAENDEPT